MTPITSSVDKDASKSFTDILFDSFQHTPNVES